MWRYTFKALVYDREIEAALPTHPEMQDTCEHHED